MARLIDVDIDVENYVTVWETNGEYGKQTVMAVDDLRYLPTVDAVKVVHAHFVSCKTGIKCSNCGAREKNSAWCTHKYCYKCGAKMYNERKNN